MNYYETDDLAQGYKDICRQVLDEGANVAPRGLKTKELLGFKLVLRDPMRALVRGCDRKISVPVAAAEALQLVGGFSDPASMLQVSPHFKVFQDGGVFHAPYGPRIAPQLPKVIGRLRADASTRQAHIQVWDPLQDLFTDVTRDYPCTVSLQFMVRNGELLLFTNMRANDAWRGFPYDVFQFTQLQLAVANTLDIQPGAYHHYATSFHLYEENWAQAAELKESDQPRVPGIWGGRSWSNVQDRARKLFYGEVPEDSLGNGELLMSNALRRRGVTGSW